MRYTKCKNEIKEIQHYMRLAAEEARKSTCKKSQRGALIVKGNEVLGRGYNKVTLDALCDPCIREKISDNGRVELCSAIHAEQMAIIAAVNNRRALGGSRMYCIKIKDGQMRASGMPSCTVCSRMIYEAKIAEFVLWHKSCYAIYNAKELNELSFKCILKS